MTLRVLSIFISFWTLAACSNIQSNPKSSLEEKLYPSEQHFLDKLYPEQTFHYRAYFDALRNVQTFKGNVANRSSGSWTVEGPGNIGARINTIAVHPTNENIILVGFSEGGIFKTINGGLSWYPVFDDQIKLCIGDITYNKTNPNIVFAGTGDPNISGFPFVGNGIFKSVDGGENWSYTGLGEVGVISHIRISPDNPNVLYVGAMGLPFIKSSNKGLYKSSDAGASWQKVLYINDSTGVIDIAIHPQNGNILYATTWNRIRNNKESLVAGPDAKIYKSVNGGLDWVVLGGGLPSGNFSRLGIDISTSNPNVLYASFTNAQSYNLEAIYKTTDAGNTWTSLPIYDDEDTGLPKGMYGGFGWYFAKIRINPNNENDIFILGIDMFRSKDGGLSWALAVPPWWTYEVHADKHDLVFSGQHILLATDGGLYKSSLANTEVWEDIENIPATQFYRVAYNPHKIEDYYGGAQDNGSTGGNAQIINDWDRIYGGDGFQMAFNRTNENVFYASSQNGNIVVTTNGGQSFKNATEGINDSDPRNWDAPYFISQHDTETLYTGTNKVYVTEGSVVPNWQEISPVLTDPTSNAFRKNISAIAESPVQANDIYAGTTDGMIWSSGDKGASWVNINGSLPRRYITAIQASPFHESEVFISLSGYRDNDNTPHIYYSNNKGKNWVSIQSNMPNIAINSILVLPDYDGKVLFAATDAGVFYTINKGESWQTLGDNMPSVAVYHLGYNSGQNKIIAGTFGRSIMSFALDQVQLISHTKYTNINYEFTIVPSLVSDILKVSIHEYIQSNNHRAYIMNQAGKILRDMAIPGSEFILNLADLPSGKYYFSVYSHKKMATKTFIKT
ncbi:MAG: hypothetical protein WAT79_00825 [Saprospiraceae bacterium]